MRRRCPDDRRRRHYRSSGLHSARGASDQPGRHRPGRSGNHGSHPNTDPYPDPNTNADADPYPDSDSNTHINAYEHADAHSNADTDTHSHPDVHSNTYEHADAYSNADDYPDAHQHADARPNPDADTHSHQYSNSDAYLYDYSNARPRSHRRRSGSDCHSPRLRGRPSIYHWRKHADTHAHNRARNHADTHAHNRKAVHAKRRPVHPRPRRASQSRRRACAHELRIRIRLHR